MSPPPDGVNAQSRWPWGNGLPHLQSLYRIHVPSLPLKYSVVYWLLQGRIYHFPILYSLQFWLWVIPRYWVPLFIPPPNEVGGGYTGFTLSVCPSVRLSVCRRHGFRSISQVCFGISISNFICILMVAIGRSLLIFSDVAFKMAAWRPYCIFWFPDSNFSLALNINFKLQGHNTYVYG